MGCRPELVSGPYAFEIPKQVRNDNHHVTLNSFQGLLLSKDSETVLIYSGSPNTAMISKPVGWSFIPTLLNCRS